MQESTYQLIYEYFETFVPSMMERSIFAELDNLDIVMGFLITDCEAQWSLTLEQGHLVNTIRDASENPEVLFEMESATFLQIVSGAISPQKSFFANRVTFQGDTLKALKMVSIFEQFIKEHPFHVPIAFTSEA